MGKEKDEKQTNEMIYPSTVSFQAGGRLLLESFSFNVLGLRAEIIVLKTLASQSWLPSLA